MSAQQSLPINLMAETLRASRALIPLSAMKVGFLEELIKRSDLKFLCAKDLVFERHEVYKSHYYLLSGAVSNQYASGFSEIVEAGDTLRPLADEQVPGFSCIAETDATILVVDSDALDRFLSWSQISEYLLSLLCSRRDLDGDIDWINMVLNSNLFYKVPPVNAEGIIAKMEPEKVQPGEVIVREGEIGKCCYFIKSGHAVVTRTDSRNKVVDIARIGAGCCFGEDSLLYETLRSATVIMEGFGELIRLTKENFKVLVQEPAIEEINEQGMAELTEKPVLIDVRSQGEYESGHLAISANIPLHLLGLKQRLLQAHIPYVFYCDTGRRSRAAAYLLSKQGYNAVALKGGLVGAGMQYQLVSDFSYMLKDGGLVRAG